MTQRLIRVDLDVKEGTEMPDEHYIAAYVEIALSFMSTERIQLTNVRVESVTDTDGH
jgi:hypothetical protein